MRILSPITYLFLFLGAVKAGSSELGYYSIDQPRFGEILRLEKLADRTITCNQDLKFDIGIGSLADGSRRVIWLTMDEIREFLISERHKNLLIVHFPKSIMMESDLFIKKRISEMHHLLFKLGYKRVIILGDSSSGIHYLSDSEKSETKKQN